ncbi:MAG: hypothetical protein A3F14_06660 [Gammaproteobacteria bacterium RIFCSPHIGHO2_12_FULL_43_28]|nr:MAG: hypothetical protein A3F14_06660 [Gammaproteobacteria bacterium RIFCSPHIGHO2_12_FULL_43_28]
MNLKRNISKLLLFSTFYPLISLANQTVTVETYRMDRGYPHYLQFTVDGSYYSICSGYPHDCDNRVDLSIDAEKEYIFNIFEYDGGKINDDCKNQKLFVKPGGNQIISIYFSRRNEIRCSYSS